VFDITGHVRQRAIPVSDLWTTHRTGRQHRKVLPHNQTG
jgi:hypothetical protein